MSVQVFFLLPMVRQQGAESNIRAR